jgi:hypothetical protein
VSWIIFSGPTIAPTDVAREVGDSAICRGPAGHGDVYDAVQDGAQTILLVDGYFEHRLSVWHKEILWALFRGVRVYGASSLGALRAVELAPFGMVGIGRVFERFRDGDLEDDDEVAVVHAPAEQGYRPLSEALVNVRASIERAIERRLIGRETARALVGLAKSQFYPSRSLRALLALAASSGIGEAAVAAFAAAVDDGSGVVDQKRLDALEALRTLLALRQTHPAGAQAAQPAFHFEYTEAWHETVQWLNQRRGTTNPR